MFASSGSSRTRRFELHGRSPAALEREGAHRELLAGRHPNVRGEEFKLGKRQHRRPLIQGRDDRTVGERSFALAIRGRDASSTTYPQSASRPGFVSGGSRPVNGNGSGCAYVWVK
jgi:hypothetical protein